MECMEIFESSTFHKMCDFVVPPCAMSAGASAPDVIRRLTYIYQQFRPKELGELTSLLHAFQANDWMQHHYFPTFTETVTEAYWTSETGLKVAGFTVATPR